MTAHETIKALRAEETRLQTAAAVAGTSSTTPVPMSSKLPTSSVPQAVV